MDLAKVQMYVRNLAILEETNSPVISCYLNLEAGQSKWRHHLNGRVRLLRKSLTSEIRGDFDEAWSQIEDYLAAALFPHAKGATIFSRAGAGPYFSALQFYVPLPNWVSVGFTPNIYHLVELKDTYHRYVIMILTEESARIVEVNLGEVTKELWQERPELRKRIGRGWTREHYQNHRRGRTEQFIKEEIRVLEQLMLAGGHSHLILVGNPRISAQVRKALPKRLAAKLVKTTVSARVGGLAVVAAGSDRISEVVAASLSSFIEQEELESLAVVDRLQQGIHTGGLAVVGTRETLRALQNSQVDMLVMASGYEPDPGWACAVCGAVGIEPDKFHEIGGCGWQAIRSIDIKEEMVRIAERTGCSVEIVNGSIALTRWGGVGALLRFLAPDQYNQREVTRYAAL
jgi:hypothetical protein